MKIGKRGLKCRDTKEGLSGGVMVESYIETKAQNCSIGIGEQASHVVRIENWMTMRVEVEMTAECESPHLTYAFGCQTWTGSLQVQACSDSGGSMKRTMRGELNCGDAFVDQGIKMTVRCTAIGYPGTGSATFQLLLDSSK